MIRNTYLPELFVIRSDIKIMTALSMVETKSMLFKKFYYIAECPIEYAASYKEVEPPSQKWL